MDTQTTSSTSTQSSEEQALVARLRAKEPAAFELFVRQNLPRLLTVARRILGNEDDAHEAVQDAFFSAFKAIEQFDGGSRLSTWLHRIGVNSALMKLRSRRRRPEQSIEPLLPTFLEDGHSTHTPTRWQPTPEDYVSTQEIREIVLQKVAELPESYRAVLLLRDIEELDTETTASILGVNIGVVKARLHRARQALRTLLDPLLRRDSSGAE